MQTKCLAIVYEPWSSHTAESNSVFNHLSVCRKLTITLDLTFLISSLVKAAAENIILGEGKLLLFSLFLFKLELRLGQERIAFHRFVFYILDL